MFAMLYNFFEGRGCPKYFGLFLLSIFDTQYCGVEPPCIGCNGLCVHVSVLSNGKGDTVFLLPAFKCYTQMKKIPESLNVFRYEGQIITFKTVESVLMVNATEMAKPFGKQPSHFLDNKEINDYILALSQYANSHTEKSHSVNLQTDQIYTTTNGGKNPGTWFCELLAIRFAQWLSPQFSVWVDVHIKELLYHGKTEITAKPIVKGSFLDLQHLNFHINKYTNTIEAVPDRFLPAEYLAAAKTTLENMLYILTNQPTKP